MKINNPNYLNGLTVSAEQINAAVEGGGAGLTTEQTAALGKIEGLEASASEIDGKCTFNENTLTIDGDSIASLENKGTYSRGGITWGLAKLSQRLKVIDNFGIPGQRTDEILARIDITLETEAKFICFIMGKNDVNQGKEYNNIIENMDSIYNKASIKGKIIIATTILPASNDDSTKRNLIVKLNNWIKKQQNTRKNFLIVDYYDAIIDKWTGLAKTGYLLSDNNHPSSVGGYWIGEKFKEALNPFLPIISQTQNTNLSDSIQLVENSMFLNGSPISSSWSLTGTATPSKEIIDDSYSQVITGVNTTGNYFQQSIFSGFDIGDNVEGFCELEVSSPIDVDRLVVEIICRNNTSIIKTVYGFFTEPLYHLPNETFRVTIRVPEFTIPEGTVRIMPVIETYISGEVKIHKFQIFNRSK